MDLIVTPRLRLVPATVDLVRLEIENLNKFFRQLGVEPILDWPSENLAGVLPLFLEQLESDPSLVGWLAWYWIHDTLEGNQLVGGGGFKGAPFNGVVEVGYETRASCRRRGYATEAVGSQVAWALKHPDVKLVIAETRNDNKGSISLLHKLEFVQVGSGSEVGLLRFERKIGGQ
jgi:RimJ/RimL family protein N-acetyltransferase